MRAQIKVLGGSIAALLLVPRLIGEPDQHLPAARVPNLDHALNHGVRRPCHQWTGGIHEHMVAADDPLRFVVIVQLRQSVVACRSV
jgi:hypothetical protein